MYVPISNPLKESVKSLIGKMREKEMSVTVNPTLSIPGDAPFLIHNTWKQHAKLYDVVPHNWCEEMDSVGVTCPLHMFGISTSAVVHVDLKPPHRIPPDGTRYNLKIKLPDSAEYDAIRERAKAIHEVHARWKKVETQIVDFLEKCKSLNEALKLWPQISMYIPAPYLKKVEEKRVVEKGNNEAADAAKNLDVEGLTAAAVIARMTPGQ